MIQVLDQSQELRLLEELDIQTGMTDAYGLVDCPPSCYMHHWKRLRNVAAYLLMLDAGLRVGEAVKLRYADCYFQCRPVRLLILDGAICKRAEAREVPVSSRLEAALARLQGDPMLYLDWPFTQRLISRRFQGPPMTTRQVERIIRAAAFKSLGFPVHPHFLRHTFATKLMKKADMRTVQTLLGHKNLASTQVYTHPNSDDCRQAIDSMNSGPTPVR